MLTAIIVVGGAIAVGLLANRLFRDRVGGDDKGPTARDLLGPLLTLAVLFIAFVLALSSGSYSAARSAAADEAAVVDNLYEAAEFVADERLRKSIHASLVCYARAVEGAGWEAEADGAGTSPVPSTWTGTGPFGLRAKFARLGVEDPMFGTLTSLDRERGDTRRARVSAAAGTVPAVVFAFMLALVGIALALLAFFLPRKHRGAQIATLTLVGLVLIGALALIHSLDQPFKGVLKIEPMEMAESSEQMSAEYRSAYGPGVPCDRRGVALTLRRS